jgi:hypothetical protein
MPLTDDQLRTIGLITVAFGRLEFSAFILLQVLINPTKPDIGRVAFENAPFRQVLDTIEKLCPYTLGPKPELYRQVKDWRKRADNLRVLRNTYLHAMWAHDQPSGEMVVLTRKVTSQPPRATDLDKFAVDVANAAREADQILFELLPRAN